MGYKFSFTCDYELVGFCMDIVGMNADKIVEYKKHIYHEIKLIDFQFSDEYLSKAIENKSFLGGPGEIHVLDNEGISIGVYNLYVGKQIKYNELKESVKDGTLTLICSISCAVGNEIRLWDKWRLSRPKKNEWVILNDEDKKAWLNIVRKYHFSEKRYNYEPYDDISGGTYYLDGSSITTVESFFCALGEAMNGPGGYYGFNESNLIDCLTGGFRVHYPFKLVWKNSTIALKNLTKEEWENSIRRDKEIDSRMFEDYPEVEPSQSFFIEILEIFLDYGVTVELEP